MKTRFVSPLIVSLLVVIVSSEVCAGRIVYVDDDATGANDGSSWPNAYRYLQDALTAAVSGDEVRVAQGIYKLDRGAEVTPGDRNATFQLKTGVAIKGGYAGLGEPDPNTRDITLYETILSGDLSGNDGPDFANYGENSFHVVTAISILYAKLEGLVITAGYSIPPFGSEEPLKCGGGMYNRNSSPVLTNCTFRRNKATRGGGMYNTEGSNPTLYGCVFTANAADDGGGFFNGGVPKDPTKPGNPSSPTLTKCTFEGNFAHRGGGMYTEWSQSRPNLTNCDFIRNAATYGGGGIHNDNGTPTLKGCHFVGNSTLVGGGMIGGGALYSINAILTSITNCIFSGNSSEGAGGAM